MAKLVAKASAKPAAKVATKAAAPAAKTSKGGITAYDVKTKTKNVPMLDAVININNGRYIASGLSKSGNKLTAIMSKANAEAAIASGNAEEGEGW